MIGDIKRIGKNYYFQANREGTLVRLARCSFWRRFWLELRDGIKKWDMNEAIEFAKRSRLKRLKNWWW